MIRKALSDSLPLLALVFLVCLFGRNNPYTPKGADSSATGDWKEEYIPDLMLRRQPSAPGTYSSNMTYATNYLQVGLIDLTEYSGTLKLKFLLWFDDDDSYDFACLEISTDGTNFALLTPTTPAYDEDDTSSGSINYNSWGYDRHTPSWTPAEADLSSYAGSGSVYIRWAFKTGDFDSGDYGLYIDSVEIGSFSE